ncbi:hypothetical protein AMK59_6624 [Oryctes borbonicus]|uniref:Poly(A) RNA polymerase mitochondrial-like central palm domain-containing protein n=1 Tax=Oryctes borbonicus TaxID=1629725 RepID=A0A0T6AVL1_9SCAR|nr:hypothetical protein AMK59_6624 [Oryctes borbonicus]
MSIFCILNLKNSQFCKLIDVLKCLKQRQIYANSTSYRSLSQRLGEINGKQNSATFHDVIANRKLEAKRSILVQVQSAQSCKELYTYCNAITPVKQMFHYSTGVEPLHFIIVEFSKEADVSNVLSQSTYAESLQIVPVQSLFLWFKAPVKKNKQKVLKAAKLQIENGTFILNEDDVRHSLKEEKSVSNQMLSLYNSIKLNDISTRLRFIVARQIETALSGLFPHVVVYPFGSSVNGFGRMGCDLDLVLRLNENQSTSADSRLVFHSKAITASERSTSQRHMEVIGDLLQLFLPGCSHVRRILQARVPIIKFYQQLADVECDLSMSNMSGVHMSNLLHLMGEFDSRVRPLVFTVRKWAAEVGLTNSHPGRWITNFSLGLMVLAFLQKPGYAPPVLPGLNLLIKSAGPEDTFITEEGINCTFLRNPERMLDFRRLNTDSLQSLLEQFFVHYSNFDFSMKAVCLNEGSPVTKPDHSPLYIVNPLEQGLNVSKNVSMEELERLKMEMRNATWILESQEVKGMNWGVLSLFDGRRKFGMSPAPRQAKLLEVSTLFETESDGERIEFKSGQVEREISHVKSETKENIKQIEMKSRRRKSRR